CLFFILITKPLPALTHTRHLFLFVVYYLHSLMRCPLFILAAFIDLLLKKQPFSADRVLHNTVCSYREEFALLN
ncbi:hypothetical protein, partial [Paenibacillus luteus]|uniref:hypothetical protein n=1 Tax=Paenibacillus luteus TaxID=2545753 RepID=UPI0019D5D33B